MEIKYYLCIVEQKTDIMKSKMKAVLASTSILDYDYEEFKECYMNENDCDESKVPSRDSRDFWNWAGDERDADWESDMDEIKNCDEYDYPCVVEGHAGLWYGTRDYYPVRFNTIWGAISRILIGSYDDVDIEWEDGKIYVYGHHHDGTNLFIISFLSKKGQAKFDTAEKNFADVSELKKWDYKKIPYLYAI